jgi:hypothetical protein
MNYFFSNMTLTSSPKKKWESVNYEEMQTILSRKEEYLMMNTLSPTDQKVLIKGTLRWEQEEEFVNAQLFDLNTKNKTMVIYGRNYMDESVVKKAQQLISLGAEKVCIYHGGIFEWTCLGDIFGLELFPLTDETVKIVDILQYRPKK